MKQDAQSGNSHCLDRGEPDNADEDAEPSPGAEYHTSCATGVDQHRPRDEQTGKRDDRQFPVPVERGVEQVDEERSRPDRESPPRPEGA